MMCRRFNFVLVIAIIWVAGCGESNTDNSQNDNAANSQNGVDNAASGPSLPKEFPTDVPSYPDSKVAGVLGNAQQGYMLSLETEATIAEATNFYKTRLAADGWTLVGAVEKSESTTMTATKDDRNLVIGISIENAKTIISMNVSPGT